MAELVEAKWKYAMSYQAWCSGLELNYRRQAQQITKDLRILTTNEGATGSAAQLLPRYAYVKFGLRFKLTVVEGIMLYAVIYFFKIFNSLPNVVWTTTSGTFMTCTIENFENA